MSITDLTAKQILEMTQCRSGHPNEEGYPYTRGNMLSECRRRGKALLEELGWPSDPQAVYWNRYTNGPETLESICDMDKDDDFRHKLHESEEELRKTTNGEYPENIGIECMNVADWKKILSGFDEFTASYVKIQLRECVRLHKGFYERIDSREDLKPISQFIKSQICEGNICSMALWFGLDVNKPEPPETLPKQNIYNGAWGVLEHWSPDKPVTVINGKEVELDTDMLARALSL